MCRHYMFVCACVPPCVWVKSIAVHMHTCPGISYWVVAWAALVVRLTRVKPDLFETGLTPQLSYALCVWGEPIFCPSPHVCFAEWLKAESWNLRGFLFFSTCVWPNWSLLLFGEISIRMNWFQQLMCHAFQLLRHLSGISLNIQQVCRSL